MSLRAINQNLLPILLALLRDRSVTRAARSLALTQPAVSKALKQLRVILGDELLIKTGRRVVLTQRAEELLAPVTAICADLEQLWCAQNFDPTTSTREFVIAGWADYCAMIMVPALAPVLAAEAPGVSMRFVDLNPHHLVEERTDIDFAMVPELLTPRELIDAGSILPLFTEEFVAVVAKGHPLASQNRTRLDDIADTRSITFGDDDPFLPKDMRGKKTIAIRGSPSLAVVSQHLILPILAVLTGTVAVVPRRLAALIAPVVSFDVVEGIAPERRVETLLVWHRRRDSDAGHRWFRHLVSKHLAEQHAASS